MTSARMITDTAYGDAETHGLLPFNVLGLVHLQRGGSSPFSRKFLYQNRAASTPCDRLANRLDATCESIHESNSGVTVTLILGLLSEAMYSKIPPVCINMGGEYYTLLLLLSSSEGVPNETKRDSERYVRQLLRRHPEAPGDRGDANGPENRDGAFAEPPGEDQACDHGHDGVLHGLRGSGGQLRQVPPLTEACP